ncbi:MAG TPA: ParB N-terminal domain-containing protein [Candidatus Saccharimonadales bacterium]|nr:ParB N-terminal domain-containing protein [Candidatus Saccharimonadales bacterium]
MKKTNSKPGDDNVVWKVVPMPVDQLILDPDNPRLASADAGSDPKQLVKYMWEEMAVDEVALSIAANGFFHEEPLLVIPSDKSKKEGDRQKYIVVEGNRRLCAVMLLRDPKLREFVKATDLPHLTAKEVESLKELPVSLYDNREDLWEYFGFRHINGPKAWDAEPKAKYVATVHEKYKVALADIARKIGDQHSYVKRIYRGFVLLEQAEKVGFDREDRKANRFNFSHLYTAADQQPYQKFLGIESETSLKRDPVPKSKLDDLKQLMVWLYGSKSEDKAPIIRTQNPDLNYLRQVISNKTGLAALRSGIPLDRALQLSKGDSQVFREALLKGKVNLQEAKSVVTTGYKGDEEDDALISDLRKIMESIETEMAEIVKSAGK